MNKILFSLEFRTKKGDKRCRNFPPIISVRAFYRKNKLRENIEEQLNLLKKKNENIYHNMADVSTEKTTHVRLTHIVLFFVYLCLLFGDGA